MKHVFVVTPRHLATTGLYSIRHFSTSTCFNSSSDSDNIFQQHSNPPSSDEAQQEGDKTTSAPGKESELRREASLKTLHSVLSGLATKRDRLPETPLRKIGRARIGGVPNSAPGSLGRLLARLNAEHSALKASATPRRDSLTHFQSIIADAVAPSSDPGRSHRPRYDRPEVAEVAEESTQLIPRPLRRLSPNIQKLLRSELGVIATKLEHGARVRRWELNKYLKYLEVGIPQYWDAHDRERDRVQRDDKTRAGVQSSKWWREVAMVQRFEATLVQLEQLHRVVTDISPFSLALLKRLKKAKEHNFYLTAPINNFKTSTDVEKQREAAWGKDRLTPSGVLTDSIVEEKARETEEQEGEKEKEREETGATERTGSVLDLAYALGRSPSTYSKRVEGVIEPDTIHNVLKDVKAPLEQLPIARLEHNLERVLFNPGVHWLQDPRSRVYNYPPYLKEIPSVNDFAFNQIEPFQPPSSDPDIPSLMREHDKKFAGSTSSLSGMLCHLYFLISGDKRVNTSIFSRYFSDARGDFTAGQRMPTSVLFRWQKDDTKEGTGRYYIDGNGSNDGDKNILTWMGMMLERFLTMPKERFDGFLRSKAILPPPERSDKRDAFRFTKTNNFIMRSQLDCHDPRLPGSGVFDIKTRACMPIRIDLFNFQENSGYLIRTQHGKYESFEREYFDLVRSAFLKYQFQVRIGGMDGVIVAYHNTKQMFGFQYISIDEMDTRLFGPGQGTGDRIFKACVTLLENVVEEVVACFPEQDVRATFETLEHSGMMTVFVERVGDTARESERPMKLLEVETLSCLDNELVKPWDGFVDMDKNWSVRWTILKSSKSSSQVRQMYYAAKHRQFRAWAMPTGVDPDDLQEWYENLNFGNSEKEQEASSSFRPEKFNPQPDPVVLKLRQMAREGRRDTERRMMEEMNRPQYVVD